MREIKLKKNTMLVSGMTAPAGTVLYVEKELDRPPNIGGGKMFVVKVDNGTGDLKLMPRDALVVENKKLRKMA